jgi:hypothetical protein
MQCVIKSTTYKILNVVHHIKLSMLPAQYVRLLDGRVVSEPLGAMPGMLLLQPPCHACATRLHLASIAVVGPEAQYTCACTAHTHHSVLQLK